MKLFLSIERDFHIESDAMLHICLLADYFLPHSNATLAISHELSSTN